MASQIGLLQQQAPQQIQSGWEIRSNLWQVSLPILLQQYCVRLHLLLLLPLLPLPPLLPPRLPILLLQPLLPLLSLLQPLMQLPPTTEL
jgi:hypothetical protein